MLALIGIALYKLILIVSIGKLLEVVHWWLNSDSLQAVRVADGAWAEENV